MSCTNSREAVPTLASANIG